MRLLWWCNLMSNKEISLKLNGSTCILICWRLFVLLYRPVRIAEISGKIGRCWNYHMFVETARWPSVTQGWISYWARSFISELDWVVHARIWNVYIDWEQKSPYIFNGLVGYITTSKWSHFDAQCFLWVHYSYTVSACVWSTYNPQHFRGSFTGYKRSSVTEHKNQHNIYVYHRARAQFKTVI